MSGIKQKHSKNLKWKNLNLNWFISKVICVQTDVDTLVHNDKKKKEKRKEVYVNISFWEKKMTWKLYVNDDRQIKER